MGAGNGYATSAPASLRNESAPETIFRNAARINSSFYYLHSSFMFIAALSCLLSLSLYVLAAQTHARAVAAGKQKKQSLI
ncbi:hypothetical protein [Herbaspirillum lusitanum]|uniref:hypothetical protein n=1 Tax=Herbaspirillum lusitanum TaxID=213312 RepID=UPI0012F4A094|nr:hypothetical protein [Herbaspirillum lusitanum]